MTSMLRHSLCALLTLVCAALWQARVPAQAQVQAQAQAQGSEFTAPDGSLEVVKGQGRLVRLSGPASSVFIANPAVADVTVKSTRMVYVFGVTTGTTTLYAVDKNENLVADIKVVVTHDMDRLESGIESLVPAGGITATSVSSGILLDGSVPNATDAENLRRLATRFLGENEEVISRLKVTEPNQVNVRVRIAEVSRTAIRQIGLNFDILSGDFSFTSGDVFLSNPETLSGTAPFFTLTGDQFGAGLSSLSSGGTSILLLFDLLEEIGLAKTLAEPNLTAISGETASFLAGGEFPIPVNQDEGTISIEFKEFGVSLAFTPTVLSGSRVSMRVRPEFSQLSNAGAVNIDGVTVSALTTRRAETTIELASGQSFAIAGLLQEDFQDAVRQIPYFADVPIFGELFKSESFRSAETELIIVVTPYIVQPVDSPEMPLPTDPLTKTPVDLAHKRERKPSANLSRVVEVPVAPAGGQGETGTINYLLD